MLKNTKSCDSPTPQAILARVDALKSSLEYRNYLYARERVLKMTADPVAEDMDIFRPSQYWREDLASFEYMVDASPLIIQKLRHHTHHITGLRAYEYRSNKDKKKVHLVRKLEALRSLDKDNLLVPEHPALGGFGFENDGKLYNVDTLKFYEVLIGLSRANVLGQFRNAKERKIVWEIGAGWGGFAYQFKTLCPNTTYVIMDLPEVILFSAVYLKTLFPDARVLMYGDVPNKQLFSEWQKHDFIFLPHSYLDEFSPPRIDLTVNMVSFQEMTDRQVDAYVRKSATLGSPYLYSLNRKRSLYNTEIKDVGKLLARYYNVELVEVLEVEYNQNLPLPVAKTESNGGRIWHSLQNLLGMVAGAGGVEIKKSKHKMPYQHLLGKLKK
ncbi:putative sugar O-methyltransferase [Nitrosomonadaceae bacterium]|nr:putative sugar O-methyltransferase [Nitrosomonadaceae bacterium]